MIKDEFKDYTEFRLDLKIGLLHTEMNKEQAQKTYGKEICGEEIIGDWNEYWLSKSTIQRILAVLHNKGLREGKGEIMTKRKISQKNTYLSFYPGVIKKITNYTPITDENIESVKKQLERKRDEKCQE